ncbi:unnamed protein product [Rhizopus microsporus]
MLQSQSDSSTILLEAFQPYRMPPVFSHQTSTDHVDGHHSRFQTRCLGSCHIKLKSVTFPTCTFSELTESEISEISSSYKEEMTDESTALLPPKKRKRTKVIRYDLIFTVSNTSQIPMEQQTLYLFPREAMTECLTESAPHKILYSFYQDGQDIEHEEYTHDTRQDTIISILMSSVPQDLYLAMKQMVASYELMCQSMMDLMRLHYEKAAQQKMEVSLPDKRSSKIVTDHWSSAEDDWDKDEDMAAEEEEDTFIKPTKRMSTSKASIAKTSPIKKCLYCGCKTTPMWRRGPQGAGTLCNACGVKWKHGKILSDKPPNGDTVPTTERRRKSSIAGSSKKTNKKKQSNAHEEANNLPITWESATSSDSSPLDSFSCSPNSSPSLATSLMDKRKPLIPYDSQALSVYVGENAIEAAAVLTLLKKTK